MIYELCLEYGIYLFRFVDVWVDEINIVFVFIIEDKKFLEFLEEVNILFYEFFLMIECFFYYIGYDFLEKRVKII